MFTPIMCGTCEQGKYAPAGPDLYACTMCSHVLATTDFVLDPEERLICRNGVMHTQIIEGLYEVLPTHGVQSAYVQATLMRALLSQNVFTSTEQVNAANRLKFEAALPERGPWILDFTELRTLVIAMRWRKSAAAGFPDPRHGAIEAEIRRVYDEAVRSEAVDSAP
ncbi:hypothetical protein AB0D58_35285 [Streptomyces sp. NPDC048210]|uniref:hypothetical protein n=1 Tax=unclassified Streptomyces TaxID=2593676 RepID=UPI002E7873E1|nr:hypothetical protein [Streptomyces sp. JV181]MEE1775622.1 hypothetical protein [Streptomyces sp. JV181]